MEISRFSGKFSYIFQKHFSRNIQSWLATRSRTCQRLQEHVMDLHWQELKQREPDHELLNYDMDTGTIQDQDEIDKFCSQPDCNGKICYQPDLPDDSSIGARLPGLNSAYVCDTCQYQVAVLNTNSAHRIKDGRSSTYRCGKCGKPKTAGGHDCTHHTYPLLQDCELSVQPQIAESLTQHPPAMSSVPPASEFAHTHSAQMQLQQISALRFEAQTVRNELLQLMCHHSHVYTMMMTLSHRHEIIERTLGEMHGVLPTNPVVGSFNLQNVASSEVGSLNLQNVASDNNVRVG